MKKVLIAEPRTPDAIYLQGAAAMRRGDLKAAIHHYRDAHHMDNSSEVYLVNLAQALMMEGRVKKAISMFSAFIRKNPNSSTVLFELGNAYLQTGDFEKASRAYQSASKISPHTPQFQSALGIACTYLEKLDAAAAAYKSAISLGAADAETHFNLGSVYLRQERLGPALSEFDAALKLDPDHQRSHRNIGLEYARIAKFDKSLTPLESAVALDCEDMECVNALANALAVTKNFVRSLEVCEQALTRQPDNLSVLVQYASCLICAGQHQKAARVSNRVLEINPGNTAALAFIATALNEAGDRKAAARYLDFHGLLKTTIISPSHGFSSIEEFNSALEATIYDHPTLSVQESNRSLSNGRSTDNLFDGAETIPLVALKDHIIAAVDQYKLDRPVDSAHPFMFRHLEDVEIFCWANVMDTHGFHDVHFHPSSWLSGVYYPRVPDIVRDNGGTSTAGWIEFGRAFYRLQSKDEPPVHLVQPLEGLMVLFPSYFGHRTIPFESTQKRISVAFDIIPLGG